MRKPRVGRQLRHVYGYQPTEQVVLEKGAPEQVHEEEGATEVRTLVRGVRRRGLDRWLVLRMCEFLLCWRRICLSYRLQMQCGVECGVV